MFKAAIMPRIAMMKNGKWKNEKDARLGESEQTRTCHLIIPGRILKASVSSRTEKLITKSTVK